MSISPSELDTTETDLSKSLVYGEPGLEGFAQILEDKDKLWEKAASDPTNITENERIEILLLVSEDVQI